jgi:hypothetical protein
MKKIKSKELLRIDIEGSLDDATKQSPIVKLKGEIPSSVFPHVTIEEFAQDLLKNFIGAMSEEQKNNFRVAAEILAQNKKDCEQFEGRDGL